MKGKPTPARRRVGRPPAGAEGERVKDYPQLSLRVPPNAKALLYAISIIMGQPQWRLVTHAIERTLDMLPREDQLKVRHLAARRTRQRIHRRTL